MINYDKPFLSYNQMVDKLINEYGLVVNDIDFTIKSLKKYSYYDLVNGYQECLMNKISNKFIPRITTEYLVIFHNFDKGFQNILFMQSVIIEKILKTTLAYHIAENIKKKKKTYLDPHYYKKKIGKTNSI